jgi:glutamate synthase domain-containing protein 2/glutamate synthase domain-containing protein 1/glutamate synthase domain-containing protein 3
MFFLPAQREALSKAKSLVSDTAASQGFGVLCWRDVPTLPQVLGARANKAMPRICQAVFAPVHAPASGATRDDVERSLFILRKHIEQRARQAGFSNDEFYIPSLSSRTIVYKGMFVASQFANFYPDLRDPLFESQFAIVHQRYSTNTFPSWPLAQPFHMIAHNGEINTLRKNINSMKARQATMASPLFSPHFFKDIAVLDETGSDSAIFDNIFELLVHAGRRPEQVFAMMVQEPFGEGLRISHDKRAYYDFHAAMLETWDGPAAMSFTDGRVVGAALDRNGLRPFRYTLTKSGRFVGASEAGVLDIEESDILERGILRPGEMILADIQHGRLIDDAEIKAQISRDRPYRRWLETNRIELRGLFSAPDIGAPCTELQHLMSYFNYSKEIIDTLKPMLLQKQEAISAMGTKKPPAILSRTPVSLCAYFRQRFAQVTNPAIDPYRESAIMSLENYIGTQKNLLEETPEHCRQLKLQRPVLSNSDMEKLKNARVPPFVSATVSMLVPAVCTKIEEELDRMCREAERAIEGGANLIILSDRGVDARYAAIPSLLAAAAVHSYLVDAQKRHLAGLIVETGEARDVHEIAVLLAYGASGVNPWMVFELLPSISSQLEEAPGPEILADHYIEAVNKGILKIMSKLGIATVSSYRGSRMFEAVGLSEPLVKRYFRGTESKFGGIGLEEIAEDILMRHRATFKIEEETSADDAASAAAGQQTTNALQGSRAVAQSTPSQTLGEARNRLSPPGALPWPPSLAARLTEAVRRGDIAAWRAYADGMDSAARPPFALRDLFSFKYESPTFSGVSIPLDLVQPAEEIVKRFSVAAMSLGAISPEAHEALAAGANAIGSWSNSGEGGEDRERHGYRDRGFDSSNASKQIASGRFGVTARYLATGLELQIKIAQGAKPGEGGQLPGAKVNEYIAKLRHSKPGVTLISPPPHHDIYSIEDLSQLIYDLRCINPNARIAVKLAAQSGIGTVAAGVAKAGADCIIVSSGDGGTGAAPLSSLDYAGGYWEAALPEVRQVLAMNNLDLNTVIQVDGRLRTARDIVIAAILGAREFAFGTAALIAMGCVACGRCNLGRCPVGIATQEPELRAKFRGQPEHLIALFKFLAEDVRTILASLGAKTLDEILGKNELLDFLGRASTAREKTLDFNSIKEALEIARRAPLVEGQDLASDTTPAIPLPEAGLRNFRPEKRLDFTISDAEALLIQRSAHLFQERELPRRLEFSLPIRNADRSVGAALSGEIIRAGLSLHPNTLAVTFRGTAGQSFGAFLAPGILFKLFGDANDYLGKGLSGGTIVVCPRRESRCRPEENAIAGNVCLYGATAGEVYLNGTVGERFCVRNSGAVAVAEGTGNHTCEYMTEGVVVILGKTGINFGAGMTGGVAYVLDEDQLFDTRCNTQDVDVGGLSRAGDIEQLKLIIERHYALTGSPKARIILDEWVSYLPRFLVVTPRG